LLRALSEFTRNLGLILLMASTFLPMEACSQEKADFNKFVLRVESSLSEQPAAYYHFDRLQDGELYPSEVVAGSEIQFRSSDGQVRHTISIPKGASIVPTASGRFIGVLGLEGSLESPGSVATQRLKVYDQNGQGLYNIGEPVSFDDTFGQFYLSGVDGRCVVGDPGRGHVRFYDGKGKLTRTVDLFSDDTYDLERNLAAAFSADGSRFALAVMKHAPAPAVDGRPAIRGEPFLIEFDASGKELFRRALPGDAVQAVAVSPRGNTVAVASYALDLADARTTLIDSAGQQIGKVDLLFRYSAYSADGTRLLLSENRRLFLVDAGTAKVLWSWSLEPGEEMISAVDLSPSASTAAALLARSKFESGEFVMTGGQLVVLGKDGSVLATRLFPLAMFRKAYLKLTEQEVAVGLDSGYKIYGKE
jgi:hypothetical protein